MMQKKSHIVFLFMIGALLWAPISFADETPDLSGYKESTREAFYNITGEYAFFKADPIYIMKNGSKKTYPLIKVEQKMDRPGYKKDIAATIISDYPTAIRAVPEKYSNDPKYARGSFVNGWELEVDRDVLDVGADIPFTFIVYAPSTREKMTYQGKIFIRQGSSLKITVPKEGIKAALSFLPGSPPAIVDHVVFSCHNLDPLPVVEMVYQVLPGSCYNGTCALEQGGMHFSSGDKNPKNPKYALYSSDPMMSSSGLPDGPDSFINTGVDCQK